MEPANRDMTHYDVRAVQYEIRTKMAAPISRVWKAMTNQINDWWLPDFHVIAKDSVVTLDAVAGGQLVERTATSSLLWYTVIEVTLERSLTLAGYITPQWGGPCSTLITCTLSKEGDATLVTLQDAVWGHVSDKLVSSLRSGWEQLLNEGLKKYVEAAT
jgi:uncharacterized protein YndB with AHSA1/START domain